MPPYFTGDKEGSVRCNLCNKILLMASITIHLSSVAHKTKLQIIANEFEISNSYKLVYKTENVIGTIVEEMKGNTEVDVIIASGDMDTLQLVDDKRVQAYTLRKGLTDTILYDEEKVKERYGFGPKQITDYKGLRGDPSDNIPGVKGIGEKTATILISEFGTLENVFKTLKAHPEKLVAAGIKPGIMQKLTEQEEQAEFSKQLAIIRRDAPIDFTLPVPWRENVSAKKVLDNSKSENLHCRIGHFIA